MIKLSACIEVLFPEIGDFADRIGATAEAGLPACEFWTYSEKDIDAIAAVELPHGMLDVALADEYVRSVEAAIKGVEQLGINVLISTTGWEPSPRPRSEQHAGIVACLKAAAPVAEEAGITLVIEPLNVLVDHPGYYLTTSAEGFEILDEVDSPNVKLLYDIYHQQVTEGNLIATITSHIAQIAHFHVADVPGRHEPGTGEINWVNVLRAIDEAGYAGYVGLEYMPTGATVESLEYIKAVVNGL